MRLSDLTGDGEQEMIYALIVARPGPSCARGPAGCVLLPSGAVVQIYRYEAGEGNGLELITTEDLTKDGVADLVFSQYTCGAHTCWHSPYRMAVAEPRLRGIGWEDHSSIPSHLQR